MNRQEKIQYLRDKVRELGDVQKGAQEVLLPNLQLTDIDVFTTVSIDVDGSMKVGAPTCIDTEWSKDISELSDEEIDRVYDAMLKHEEWEKNHKD